MLKTYPVDLYSSYSKLLQQCNVIKKACMSSVPPQTKLVSDFMREIQNFISSIRESGTNHSNPVKTLKNELEELMAFSSMWDSYNLRNEFRVTINLIDEYVKNQEMCALKLSKIKKLTLFKNEISKYKPKLEELVKKLPGLCLLPLFLEQFNSNSNLYCFFSPKEGSDKKIHDSFHMVIDIFQELKQSQDKIQEKNRILFTEVFNFFEACVNSLKDVIEVSDQNDNTGDDNFEDDFFAEDGDEFINLNPSPEDDDEFIELGTSPKS